MSEHTDYQYIVGHMRHLVFIFRINITRPISAFKSMWPSAGRQQVSAGERFPKLAVSVRAETGSKFWTRVLDMMTTLPSGI